MLWDPSYRDKGSIMMMMVYLHSHIYLQVGKFALCKIYTKARGEVSFDTIDDALMDADGTKRRIAFWSYILEHRDDENILEKFVE